MFARLFAVEAEGVPLGVLGDLVTGVERGRRERDGYRLVECEQEVALRCTLDVGWLNEERIII